MVCREPGGIGVLGALCPEAGNEGKQAYLLYLKARSPATAALSKGFALSFQRRNYWTLGSGEKRISLAQGRLASPTDGPWDAH